MQPANRLPTSSGSEASQFPTNTTAQVAGTKVDFKNRIIIITIMGKRHKQSQCKLCGSTAVYVGSYCQLKPECGEVVLHIAAQ
jgi:hypothetical protein